MAKRKVVEDDAALDVPETEVAVSETARAVADAKARLDEATAAHDEAKAAHADATKPPKPIVGKHVLCEGSMEPVEIPNPEDGPYQRRLTLGGVNMEHVGEVTFMSDDDPPVSYVIWIYRRM